MKETKLSTGQFLTILIFLIIITISVVCIAISCITQMAVLKEFIDGINSLFI